MHHYITILGVVLGAFHIAPSAIADVIDLEAPALGGLTHQQNFSAGGGFTSGGAFFNNTFTDFGSFSTWSGFALSRATDATTPGFGNQFSAVTGGGFSGSLQYGLGYVDAFAAAPEITFGPGQHPASLNVTNTTYAALSMRDGDGFAKKFGGPSGNDPDFFRLTISGYDGALQATGAVDFYLADFRFANNALDYIVNTWTTVDLSSLGPATSSLRFTLASSDTGSFGINTPTYFAVDQITTIPEPSSCVLLAFGVLALIRRRK